MQVNSPNTVGSVDYSCGYQLAKALVLREVLKVVVALSPKVPVPVYDNAVEFPSPWVVGVTYS